MVRRDFLHLRVQRAGVQDCHRPSSKESVLSKLDNARRCTAPTFTANSSHVTCAQMCPHVAPKLLPLF